MIWCLSFSDWLISLSIILCRFIHAAAKHKISFFTAKYYSAVLLYHSFLIHSSTDGPGCFHILAIVNNIVINTGVHIFFQISVSVLFGYTCTHDGILLGHKKNEILPSATVQMNLEGIVLS